MNFWKKEESNVKRGLAQILETQRAEELAKLAGDPETVFCPCCGGVMYNSGPNGYDRNYWTCYEERCEQNLEQLWGAYQRHEHGHGLYGEFFNQVLAACLGEYNQEVLAFCKIKRDHHNDKHHITVVCAGKEKDLTIIMIHQLGWTWMDWVPSSVICIKG